jgi:hypothetical protein
MTSGTFTITSWQELAVLVGIVSALAGVTGGIIRSRIDRKSAEASASDRIIRLIQQESDKRVQIVRTEFELKIAQMELGHRSQIEQMKSGFDKQIREIKRQYVDCPITECPHRKVIRTTRGPRTNPTT